MNVFDVQSLFQFAKTDDLIHEEIGTILVSTGLRMILVFSDD